jgi:hypothetical protein
MRAIVHSDLNLNLNLREALRAMAFQAARL